MIESLAAELRYSIPSVRRFLAEVGYYSSFTHNGGWYTLPSIPRFGQDGLWFYSDIGFSRAGSLTNTLVDLTTRSGAGMTAEQFGAKLRCRCHSVLVQLCRQGRLQRHKIGHSHVYLALDPDIASVQRQAVESLSVTQLPAEKSGSDFGGVYPQPRLQLRAIGQSDLTQKERYRQGRSDRKALRSARS